MRRLPCQPIGTAIAVLAVACGLMAERVRAHDTPGAAKPVSFSVLEDYDKGDDLSEPARDFALMRELGVTTWRGSFGWDDYEPRRGTYDFAWLRRFIELARRQGITLRPYVAYTPAWAARAARTSGSGADKPDTQPWNNPPANLTAWRNFIRALTATLREYPNVASLEIYNEENVQQWWEGTPAEYADTLASAGTTIHRIAPRLRVLFGGLVFPDLPFVEAVCSRAAARQAFDVLPIHAYPETWTPPDVTVENYLAPTFSEQFAGAVDRTCGGTKEIWINETGYATTAGRTEEMQAAWWVRAIATFLSHPRVTHIGIYEIKDLNPQREAIGDTPNYHLGLTRVDRTPKLAYSTVRMLMQLLNAGTIASETCDPHLTATTADSETDARAGTYCHLFVRPDGNRVLIVWTRGTTRDLQFHFEDDAKSIIVSERGLDGRAQARPLGPDGRTLNIHVQPGMPRVFHIHSE